MRKSFLITICLIFITICSIAQYKTNFRMPTVKENKAVFDSIVNKINISPGLWRPMFHSEQIAWISPPWSSQEYIYLDFPEAIFIDEHLLYLSHVSNRFPAIFNFRLPEVEWKGNDSILTYERHLPNNISFGGEIKIKSSNTVKLKLWIENQTDDTLKNILLQTCAYLHQIKEFDISTNDNKYIHVKDKGWMSLQKAFSIIDTLPQDGSYKIGWRRGPRISDSPVIIASSKDNLHHIAMTWYENTFSFIGNPEHPCFHADPFFGDIAPHQTKTIAGAIIFLQGDFSSDLKQIEN
jgi:hypothetical protein